ncbi:transcriptional regulator, TetR family [Pedococcus cremeus]|uniref:Transcriptional regulator, TetR family n=1 Tax=Pedococcus cremeus TaxID=587636 RepID=A0A1H9S976_9MICO|nr:TetR/AcrR family transcriptional regulator [Pedococcus cremeus]SER81145.1 transcriptional regulator, TetR family [Pedococcus cremeus]
MAGTVKTRRYRSALREQQAAATRTAVLAAARELFTARGWDATSVADVARAAGVSVDTVYASVGRKPELLLAVVDMVLGSAEEPVPAEQRDYVRAVRAAATAEDKIAVYAAALGRLMPAVAPLVEALRRAGETDPGCCRVWQHLVDRRAANMRLFVADLRAAGGVRTDLRPSELADVVWAMNSPEYFLLLRSRGWSARRYARHLDDAWRRLLLEG